MGADTISRTGRAAETRLILDSIRRVVRALRVSSRSCEKLSGLTSAQLFVLQQLRHESPLSVNEIADRTFTHQSTVSEVLTRLEDAGWVERKTSKADGRRMDVFISTKGKATLRKAPKTAQEDLARAIQGMNASKRAALAQLLGELIAQAGFLEQRPTLFFEDNKKS